MNTPEFLFRLFVIPVAIGVLVTIFWHVGTGLLAEWLERRAKEKRCRERYTQLQQYRALIKENTDG